MVPAAVVLLVAGALLAGPVASVAQDEVFGTDADLSRQEAEDIAIAEYPDAEVTGSELEEEAGIPVYEIELSNGVDVEIHGDTGEILGTENEDDDDDAEDQQLRENPPSLTREDAIGIAEGEYPGETAHEVELEVEAGIAVYSVELSNGMELEIDANTGEILQTEQDDD
jgi:uncharacterized membrane protein YkoI